MRFTDHAHERMVRRRISRADVELAVGYGEEIHRAGATFCVLRFRDLPRELRRDPAARRAEGTTVVLYGGAIQTVYRSRDTTWLRRKPRHRMARFA